MKKIYLFLFVFFFISFASAQTYQYGMMDGNGQFYPATQYGGGMMGMMYGGYGLGMMFFGWTFTILISAVLILLIMWLVKQLKKK